MMRADTILEVTRKLIGETEPCGDSRIDEKRAENLEKLLFVVTELLYDVETVANNRDRQEGSMRKMGESAYTVLCDWWEYTSDYLRGEDEQDETKKCLELLNAIHAFKKATKCEEILIVQKDRIKAWDENGKEHTMQPMDKWIPLSEEKPKDGTWNIFTNGKSRSVERYKKDAKDHFYPSGRWFEFEDAIAWMPLPEPYREENSDETD